MANPLSGFPNFPPSVQQAILNGPAMIPPKGAVINFQNPPNHNRAALAVAIVSLLLVTVGVLCRIYSRVFIIKKVHLEDCTYLKQCIVTLYSDIR
jgi:hypothetical protein